MNQNEFFEIYNALKANYPSIPRDCQQSLIRSSEMFLVSSLFLWQSHKTKVSYWILFLQQKFIRNCSKHANLFLTLLRSIENPTKSSIETNGCLSCLLHCNDDDCFKVWKMNYKKQLLPTIYLLQKIGMLI